MINDDREHMGTPIDKRSIAELIPFNALNPDNLNELAAKAGTYVVERGHVLCRAGDPGTRQLYVLRGEVEVTGTDGEPRVVRGGSSIARAPLAAGSPRPATVVAKSSKVTYLAVNKDLLDIMLTWDQSGSYQVTEVEPLEDPDAEPEGGDWMTRMLQTKAFHRIPPANIQAMFLRMQALHFKAGDVVVQQNALGDYFYAITEGRCVVERRTPTHPKGVTLAELGPGDCFGEEALISDTERNASVRMLTDGSMKRLSKADFMSLLNEPLLHWISYEDAQIKGASGVRWIDVRLPDEYAAGHLRNSVNIPLISLRLKVHQLDPDAEYIIYCDTGRRSSAAAFLLNERGFSNVHTLKHGLGEVSDFDLTR
jgi:CRP-like cAMP-binding protein